MNLLSSKKIHQITNHPVHLIGEDGKLSSPSALIPFCWFGVNMSGVGVKVDQFDVPVCNSFKAKILNDQLCYEVDLKEYRDSNTKFDRNLKLGLVFFMDYNEDRQVVVEEDYEDNWVDSWVQVVDHDDDDKKGFIYINTIGEYYYQ